MNYRIGVIALMVIYMTALIGLVTPSQRDWYLTYLPFFLLFNSVLLFIYSDVSKQRLLVGAISAIGASFVFEAISTHLGFIRFGSSLGWSFLVPTPIAVGLLWFNITYAASCISDKLPGGQTIKIGFATFISFIAYMLIHISAPSLDFWNPISSPFVFAAIGLGISLALCSFYYLFQLIKPNKMAIYVYGGFFIFACGLIMFLK